MLSPTACATAVRLAAPPNADGTDAFGQVLDQVVVVLAERGYGRTRFTDVSEASGVAVSTLQGYFGSREDMLIEALGRATTVAVTAMTWSSVVTTGARSVPSPPAAATSAR